MPKRNGPGIELLADPTRRRIIAVLALRPRRPSVVAAEIGLSRAATSRQLRIMEEAGLVEVRRPYHDRRSRMYAIDMRAHGQITAWLAGTDIGRPTVPQIDVAGDASDPTSTEGSPPPDGRPPVWRRAPVDYDDPDHIDALLELPDPVP